MLSNGEGLLMGIINGFGSMANRYIEDDAAIEKQRKLEEIKAQIEEQKMRTQQALELEFAPQKAQVASDIEETARNKRVGIVNDALEKRADAAVQEQHAAPVLSDTEPLTPEQQSVMESGLVANRENTRQGILNSSMERLKAERDAGYKPDPTVVNAENKEEQLAYKEKDLDKRTAQLQAKVDAEKVAAEQRAKQGEKTYTLQADNLKLQNERNENARIAGIQSLLTREEQNQETIRRNFIAQYSKSFESITEPDKLAEKVDAAFRASPQYKASEKRIEELSGRLSKALEEKPKAPEPTPSATQARTNPSGIATPVTQADYDALPSGASYFKGGKIYKKR